MLTIVNKKQIANKIKYSSYLRITDNLYYKIRRK